MMMVNMNEDLSCWYEREREREREKEKAGKMEVPMKCISIP